MPFKHSIDEKHRLLVIRGSGAGSLEETEDSARRAIRSIADGAIPPDYGALITVDAIALEPSAEEAIRIAQLIAFLQDHLQGRIAIVVSAVGKVTPAHLMAAYSSGPGRAVQVFTNEPAALAWLSLRGAT